MTTLSKLLSTFADSKVTNLASYMPQPVCCYLTLH